MVVPLVDFYTSCMCRGAIIKGQLTGHAHAVNLNHALVQGGDLACLPMGVRGV